MVSPIILYSDDFSGNRSKKWNKFDAWCITLAGITCTFNLYLVKKIVVLILSNFTGLPSKEARKFQNIHFVSCSNVVSAMDMTEPLVNDLLLLEEGINMFDASLQREILLIAPVICCLCDNVRASELINHLGSKAKKLCRFCMVRAYMSTLNKSFYLVSTELLSLFCFIGVFI